jgi:integrase
VLVRYKAAYSPDIENEQAIDAAPRDARRGRTTIVVAHRLTTIRAADCSVVLGRGRVAETAIVPYYKFAGAERVDGALTDPEQVKDQRRPRRGMANVVRISDGSAGLSSATIRRRLAAVLALYGYLVARGDVGVEVNPVPRGLPTRRRRRNGRGQPLVRSVRRLPRILEPEEVTALMAALPTQRDRAMVQAMLVGGVRGCEVLGRGLEDLHLGGRPVFVAEGKGGHQRLVPVSASFFHAVAAYIDTERATRRCHRPGLRRAQGPAPR